jgi:hypothetical protein
MDTVQLNSVLDDLNEPQAQAVDRVVSGWQSPDGAVRLTIVDGPPGTGKTHVAAAAAGRWVMNEGRKVVVLTPTHAAGARVHEKLLDVGFGPNEALQLSFGQPAYDPNRGALRFDRIEQLPPNLRRVLQNAHVLVTTWHGAQRAVGTPSGSWGPTSFLLLLDEVSQISFAAFLAILRRVYPRRPAGYALLGDPQQLPVIATQEILATNAALGVLRRHPECEPCRLQLQYRMNQGICDVVNEIRRVAFGGSPLLPGSETVASRNLASVAGPYNCHDSAFAPILDPEASVVLVDTSPFESHQLRERAVGTSWEYHAEAQLAVRLAQAVRDSYGSTDDDTMRLSSPYAAQVSLMERLGAPGAITIYRAQGREWDCVILSLARSTGRTILDETYQNLYVGFSRARCKLIVLLNAGLFQQYRVIGSVLRMAEKHDALRLVQADPRWVTT